MPRFGALELAHSADTFVDISGSGKIRCVQKLRTLMISKALLCVLSKDPGREAAGGEEEMTPVQAPPKKIDPGKLVQDHPSRPIVRCMRTVPTRRIARKRDARP